MRLNRVTVFCLCVTLLAMAAPTFAQEFRGRINGTVTDNTGAVLPGVTVTASSPALIQPQVQVTGADGSYRFLALPPGVYTIDFELTGFQNVKRQDVRVIINQTLTVDQQMNVATLQETVTVTGDSPIVDTSTTSMGTNFTKELLTEIPNARDVWAAMSQAPGMQMTGFDVGGSNTGNQTGYRSYGMDTQNQTRMEGIDTTEGTAANAGYFDFGSFEEFQVGGAGADAGAFAAGAVLSISVKSGGDRFSGTWYSDYVSESQLTDNVPDYLRTANTPDEDGFFSRTGLCFQRSGETICRGNAVKKQYDLNGDFGGPIVKQKAWFFTSWRLNDKYAYITGLGDTTEQSKLSNKYTFKGTFQLGRNNQVIGYLNKREKLQDKRGINLNTPLSAAYYQSSRNYPWKVEGTRVMGSRAFLDVLYGNWYNFFPLRPTRDYGLYDGPWTPPRQDTATGVWSPTGGNNGYQDQKRFKPQFYTTLSYFKDGWKGSHDLRFGFDWKRDRRSLFNDQPFDIWYRDNNGALAQVDIFNSSVTGINDVVYTAGWVNDTWKVTNRLTLNLGFRFEAYRDEWPDQSHTPNGIPELASWDPSFNPAERTRYMTFVAPKDVTAQTVASTNTISPKIGFAFDVTGDNRTVVKGFYGRSRWNSADTLADQENPVGLAQLRYAFVSCAAGQTVGCDLNGDRLVSSPMELGAFQSTQGGAGFVRVDRDLVRPHSDEISLNVEREISSGLSGRVSYVYKNMRNVWGEIDVVREAGYTVPFTINDPGRDRVVGTSDDQRFQTMALAAGTGTDRVFTNLGERGNADFQNVELAVNRRFSGKWMLLASYGMTWSTMPHTAAGARYGNTTFPYRPADRLMGEDGVETSTLWNYKIVGRYVAPWDIGVSGSWKVQSGFNFGRTISVAMPVEGNRTIRVEPITNERYPNVSILDFRLDKSFEMGRFGRVTPMMDIFNVLNSGVPTTVRTTNTATAPFQEVTAILNPRVIRFGFRYNF
jgi:hypothetical protein